MTQPLFADIIDRMKDITDGVETKRTVLNFAHEETILPFLTALGLYKDEKGLLASDWPSKDHLWKTSRIGSFASNIGILLLRCENNSTDNGDTKTISLEDEKSSEEENTSEENSSSEEDSMEDENSSEEKDSEETLFDGGCCRSADKYDWKIMMFHQGYQIVQPLCEGLLCGMSEFIEEYKHLAGPDFNNTCAIH